MSRPTTVFVECDDKFLRLRQIAKAKGQRYATIVDRYYRYRLRGPELWAPSKRPRTHVA